mmetsp:Transcript_55642/g.90689  ORF Transcript_55642/g.90689 Transcript_55642/m.90689 type:complete len:101 (+) Transcript_55642:1707-2009(+)
MPASHKIWKSQMNQMIHQQASRSQMLIHQPHLALRQKPCVLRKPRFQGLMAHLRLPTQVKMMMPGIGSLTLSTIYFEPDMARVVFLNFNVLQCPMVMRDG